MGSNRLALFTSAAVADSPGAPTGRILPSCTVRMLIIMRFIKIAFIGRCRLVAMHLVDHVSQARDLTVHVGHHSLQFLFGRAWRRLEGQDLQQPLLSLLSIYPRPKTPCILGSPEGMLSPSAVSNILVKEVSSVWFERTTRQNANTSDLSIAVPRSTSFNSILTHEYQ